MQINQVILTGYVAKDPERPSPAITSSSLANKNTITLENGAKKTHTTFVDLTFIGELRKSFSTS